jgi:predicted tellurium resistance membrane protein TerC
MGTAIRTILIAGLVTSLDDVIALAAASRGDAMLRVLGLPISIPPAVDGRTLLLKVVERYPPIVWAGAALRGDIAGDIALHDHAIEPWAAEQAAALGSGLANLGRPAALAGATLIVGGAWFLLRSRRIAAP